MLIPGANAATYAYTACGDKKEGAMHTKYMDDSDGSFGHWKKSTSTCPSCGSNNVKFTVWESSCGGYEDYKHKCFDCKKFWWIDGIDS